MKRADVAPVVRFVVLSAFGAIAFFVPIDIDARCYVSVRAWPCSHYGARHETAISHTGAVCDRCSRLICRKLLGRTADEKTHSGLSYFSAAWQEGLEVARTAPKIRPLLRENLIDGLQMASRVVPSVLSMGLLGLLAAKYTPVFVGFNPLHPGHRNTHHTFSNTRDLVATNHIVHSPGIWCRTCLWSNPGFRFGGSPAAPGCDLWVLVDDGRDLEPGCL